MESRRHLPLFRPLIWLTIGIAFLASGPERAARGQASPKVKIVDFFPKTGETVEGLRLEQEKTETLSPDCPERVALWGTEVILQGVACRTEQARKSLPRHRENYTEVRESIVDGWEAKIFILNWEGGTWDGLTVAYDRYVVAVFVRRDRVSYAYEKAEAIARGLIGAYSRALR